LCCGVVCCVKLYKSSVANLLHVIVRRYFLFRRHPSDAYNTIALQAHSEYLDVGSDGWYEYN